jgi:hypothetical protein
MKNLNEIKLRDVKENGTYLIHEVTYERFGGNESHLVQGNGKEVLDFVKEHVGFYEGDDLDKLFDWFDETNGDGDDLISIFELENN